MGFSRKCKTTKLEMKKYIGSAFVCLAVITFIYVIYENIRQNQYTGDGELGNYANFMGLLILSVMAVVFLLIGLVLRKSKIIKTVKRCTDEIIYKTHFIIIQCLVFKVISLLIVPINTHS